MAAHHRTQHQPTACGAAPCTAHAGPSHAPPVSPNAIENAPAAALTTGAASLSHEWPTAVQLTVVEQYNAQLREEHAAALFLRMPVRKQRRHCIQNGPVEMVSESVRRGLRVQRQPGRMHCLHGSIRQRHAVIGRLCCLRRGLCKETEMGPYLQGCKITCGIRHVPSSAHVDKP